MAIKKLPKLLFAKIEKDRDDSFIIADDTQNSLLESGAVVRVGIYKLVCVNEVTLSPKVVKSTKTRQ